MKNEKRNDMKSNRDLSDRFLEYACLSVSICSSIQKTIAGKVICTQLIRSSTSSGANYQEATCAESRADFIHKMYVVLKELAETQQLANIVGRSIKTAKANNSKNRSS